MNNNEPGDRITIAIFNSKSHLKCFRVIWQESHRDYHQIIDDGNISIHWNLIPVNVAITYGASIYISIDSSLYARRVYIKF